MRIVLAIAALLLALAPAVAQKPNETDGSADVLNALMLKTTQRCFALTGEERSACCRRYFDNYCGETVEPAGAAPAASSSAIVAPAAVAVPLAAPAPAVSRPAIMPARAIAGGDGPASVLNGFVMKEAAQCRALAGIERRGCCEKLLHPNACAE